MDIEQAAPEESSEKSLREELQEAFSSASQAQEVEEAPSGQEAASAAETRARDDRGRFAGKVEQQPGQDQAASPVTASTAPSVSPPSNLKPELRAAWDAAPVELRNYIAAREAEVHKGFTRMDEERNFGKQLKEVITPYMPLIQAQGSDPAKAVQSLLNTAYIFTAGTPAQKVAALQQVAQQYQIPLEHVQQYAPQQRIDPTVAALQRQVQELSQARQQELTQREQMEQHQIHSDIAAFAAQPGREHFEQVKTLMGSLLSNGHAQGLQDAYDMAVWSHPELRESVLAARQQTAKQAQVTQMQARAAAAKKAAGSVSGTPSTPVPVGAPDRSLRDEIRAQMRAHQN